MALTDILNPVSDAAGLVLGGAEFFSGLSKEKKDKQALDSLKQPFYSISSEIYQNRNLAAQQAGQGLPSATRQYETQEAQRGLGAGLDAILRSGGGVNDAALLTQGYNNQIGKIGSQDAEMHTQNLQYFMKANADLAGEKTKQWTINEYQPFEAKLKELKQNIQTDEQNKWGGLNTAVGSLSAGATSMLNSRLFGGGNQKGGVSDPYSAYSSASGYVAPTRGDTRGGVPSPAAGVPWINPGGPSPAAGIGQIDPNSFSQSALVQ